MINSFHLHFVLVVNTRQLKKARMKHRSYINNNVANTLVEHNGELRPGNMADMESVSWKAIRNDHEHSFAGAKQGWLDRMNRNATKSWGRAPPRIPRLQQPIPLSPVEPPKDSAKGDDVVASDTDTTDNDVTTSPAGAAAVPMESEVSPENAVQESVDTTKESNSNETTK
jgi:hypothetical protein